jgi:hypothetical protein
MSPIVRVITAKEPQQVFIPIEDIPLVLSDLRRSLPQLREELCRRWPVETVHLEERRPRRKNPLDPLQVVEAACIGLVVVFSSAVLKAAGTKVGEGIGDGIKTICDTVAEKTLREAKHETSGVTWEKQTINLPTILNPHQIRTTTGSTLWRCRRS